MYKPKIWEDIASSSKPSFEISKLLAQSKKPHTVGETLVKPYLIKAVEKVFKLKAKKNYKISFCQTKRSKGRVLRCVPEQRNKNINK